MMPNRTEHVLADYGAVHAGGVPVTFYATLAAEQVGFVAGDCAARIAVLDGADQLARWQPVLAQLPALSTIIVRDASACPAGEQYLTWDDFAALGRERLAADPELVTARLAGITPEDPVTLLYTSGTTGNPKGVLLTHHCILYEVAAAILGGNVNPHVRWVSYLPLAHIAERMFSIYLPLSTAGHVHFCPDVQQLVKTVGEVSPDRVLRRAPGLGEDQGRDPGPAGRRGRPGPAGRGRAGHGRRPPVRGEHPVRPDHAGRAGRGVPPGR